MQYAYVQVCSGYLCTSGGKNHCKNSVQHEDLVAMLQVYKS